MVFRDVSDVFPSLFSEMFSLVLRSTLNISLTRRFLSIYFDLSGRRLLPQVIVKILKRIFLVTSLSTLRPPRGFIVPQLVLSRHIWIHSRVWRMAPVVLTLNVLLLVSCCICYQTLRTISPSADSATRRSGTVQEEALVDEEKILSLLENSQSFLSFSHPTSNHSPRLSMSYLYTGDTFSSLFPNEIFFFFLLAFFCVTWNNLP